MDMSFVQETVHVWSDWFTIADGNCGGNEHVSLVTAPIG